MTIKRLFFYLTDLEKPIGGQDSFINHFTRKGFSETASALIGALRRNGFSSVYSAVEGSEIVHEKGEQCVLKQVCSKLKL